MCYYLFVNMAIYIDRKATWQFFALRQPQFSRFGQLDVNRGRFASVWREREREKKER